MDKQLELELKLFALEIRKRTMESIASIGVGHVGGSMSVADVLAVLYGHFLKYDPENPHWADRDKVVLSKGHAGPALYSALALKGFFPVEKLVTLNQNGTMLPSHADRLKTPGIDVSTGSLGQGSSLAVGLALSDKLDGKDCYTYLIMSDGDVDEGQPWEAAAFTTHQKLTHLITIVDHNKLQVDGDTSSVCDLGDLAAKYAAFGFHTVNVEDGNDIAQIYQALLEARSETQKPTAIILHTVKGCGLTQYAGKASCHHCAVSKEDLEASLNELNKTEEQIRG